MPDPRPTQLQIFGERCSGTNFVAQLLRRNVPGLKPTDRYGWKHGFTERVRDEAPDTVFLIVHRDPFDWVRSLCLKPWHAAARLHGRPISEFLREQWWCEWGSDMQLAPGDARFGTEMMHERDPASGERFANVLKMRTAKLRNWASLEQRVRHWHSVRYEDVRREPKAFVRAFAQRFGLRRWPWFRHVRTFKGGPERFVPKHYESLSAVDAAWIAEQLDPAAERHAGYVLDAERGAAAR